jgi:hypothetical protein
MLNILIKQYSCIFEKMCLFLCLFYLIFNGILIKHKEFLRKNYLKLIIYISSMLTGYVGLEFSDILWMKQTKCVLLFFKQL